MLAKFAANVEFRGVVAMGVACLIESDVVFRTGGGFALDADFVFFLGLGKQCAGGVSPFLECSSRQVRLEFAVGSVGSFALDHPVALRFLNVYVVLDDGVQSRVEINE